MCTSTIATSGCADAAAAIASGASVTAPTSSIASALRIVAARISRTTRSSSAMRTVVGMSGRDRLCGADQPRAAVFEAHLQVAAGEVDEHLALVVRRRGHRHGARARRTRLSDAALPDACGHLARAVDARDLHVGAAGKAPMRLEERAEPCDVNRVADHDGVRIADRDRRQLDPVDRLAHADLHLPHRGLEERAPHPPYV